MCFMCKVVGHWVPSCTDGFGIQAGDLASQSIWISDYKFVSAVDAGAVDARGVNLVGVGDPDSVYSPDFMASEAVLRAVGSESVGTGVAAVDATATLSDVGSHGLDDQIAETGSTSHAMSTEVDTASGGLSDSSDPPLGSFLHTIVTNTGVASGSALSDSGAAPPTVYAPPANTDVILAGGSGQQGAPGGPSLSLNTTQSGAQITRDGYHWGTTLGTAQGPISFGFRTVQPSYTVMNENVQGTFTAFTAAEQVAARAAIAFWSSIANITFTDLGSSDSATIEFGNYSSSSDGSEAFTFLPASNDTSAAGSQGDVFVNTFFAGTTTAQFPWTMKDITSNDLKLGVRWNFDAPQPMPMPLIRKG